jgi:hypothetical protein
MNFIIDIEAHTLNKSTNFVRLVEYIRQCLREREIIKEQQRHIKTYSIIHYIEHIKRCINDNPLIGRALFRFYNTIKKFPSQNNRMNRNSSIKISLSFHHEIKRIFFNNSF